MKHILILGALVAAIAWLALKPSSMDKLAATSSTTRSAGDIQFAKKPDPSQLPVTPRFFAVPGRPTVVVFHDDACAGCQKMDKELADFSRMRPDVAIRKVSVKLGGKEQLDAIRDYSWKIYMTPSVLVYDAQGKLLAGDVELDESGTALLYQWMQREAQQAAGS